MGSVVRLFQAIIQWAMVLGVAGGLGEATVVAFQGAKHAHQTGLISLSKLNRSLFSPPGKSLKPRNLKKIRADVTKL